MGLRLGRWSPHISFFRNIGPSILKMKHLPWLWMLGMCLLTACDTPAEQPAADPQPTEQHVAPTPEPAKISEYEQLFRDSGLVDIQEFIPGILVDLKYTTTDNFVHADVYGDLTKCFLRKEAAEKLAKAQELLQSEHTGYSLL